MTARDAADRAGGVDSHRREYLGIVGAGLAAGLVGRTVLELGAAPDSGTSVAGDDSDPSYLAGFVHEVIDDAPPTTSLGLCITSDLTGDGREDVIVGGTGPDLNLWVNGTRTAYPDLDWVDYKLGLADPTLFWYENRDDGWIRHPMAVAPRVTEGAALGDIDGDGRVDLVAGQAIHDHDLYWFQQPADPRDRWTRHLITNDYENYHDCLVVDVDGDGEAEVVGLSQSGEALFYYDIPDDPTVEPWPDENRVEVMTGTNTKGLRVADIDGDGRVEIIAGRSIYHRDGDAADPRWRREFFASDAWEQPRIEVADLDGDGELEIVMAEGDSPALGTHPAKLGVFDREGDGWTEHILRDGLFCPHSLAVADFDGDGLLDIFVGEMGLGIHPDPELVIFRNRGDLQFAPQVISRGVPTHEAKVVDLDGDGRPDIVGKSYSPRNTVDVWYNRL